jgi:hypothetical protein
VEIHESQKEPPGCSAQHRQQSLVKKKSPEHWSVDDTAKQTDGTIANVKQQPGGRVTVEVLVCVVVVGKFVVVLVDV